MQQALTSTQHLNIWQARYEILASCCAELQRAGILAAASPLPPPFAKLPNQVGPACTWVTSSLGCASAFDLNSCA